MHVFESLDNLHLCYQYIFTNVWHSMGQEREVAARTETYTYREEVSRTPLNIVDVFWDDFCEELK